MTGFYDYDTSFFDTVIYESDRRSSLRKGLKKFVKNLFGKDKKKESPVEVCVDSANKAVDLVEEGKTEESAGEVDVDSALKAVDLVEKETIEESSGEVTVESALEPIDLLGNNIIEELAVECSETIEEKMNAFVTPIEMSQEANESSAEAQTPLCREILSEIDPIPAESENMLYVSESSTSCHAPEAQKISVLARVSIFENLMNPPQSDTAKYPRLSKKPPIQPAAQPKLHLQSQPDYKPAYCNTSNRSTPIVHVQFPTIATQVKASA